MSICRKLIEIWYAVASDKGEPSHPDPEIIKRGGWGRGRSPKKLFSALWSSVWSKYKGELKPLCWMDPPLCKGCNLPVFWQGNVSRGGSHPIHFFEKKNQPPGGILAYISYIRFLRRFGLKRVYSLSISSGIGYGFSGNLGVYERIYRFNSKWVRKKEKYANLKWL